MAGKKPANTTSAPCRVTYPTAFNENGTPLGGTWTLSVTDNTRDGITGTLESWSIIATPAPGAESTGDLFDPLAADQFYPEYGRPKSSENDNGLNDTILVDLALLQLTM